MDISALVSKIKEASEAYYKGEPIMTDANFDELTDEYTKRTGEPLPVGWGIKDGDVKLPVKMGSLDKVKTLEEVEKFLEGVDGDVTISNKWDGMACVALVKNGRIVYALTRGDGVHGKDVTRVVSHIPSAIKSAQSFGDGYMRFEVVLRKSKLSEANNWYESEFGDKDHYSNTRNAVPGLLRSSKHDPKIVGPMLSIRLHFERNIMSASSVTDALECITAHRDSLDVEIDGVVISIADEAECEKRGYHRSGNPRWAVAFKFPPREKETTLLAVNWTVGRTGRVTPVATIESVDLGTTITSVTLHNENRVAELGLNIGDTVVVSKRGDVIPAIERVTAKGSGEKVVPPATTDDADPAVILNHSFSELGVKHVSIAFFRSMFQYKPWVSVPDGWLKALSLTAEEIGEWDGYQKKSAEKVVANLAKALESPVDLWVGALNINIVSKSTAGNVLRETGSLRALIQELGKDSPDLGANVGEGKTSSLVANKAVLSEALSALASLGVDTDYHSPIVTESRFTGKKVVITGTLPDGISRARAKDILVGAGAKPSSSISKSTDYLLAGENAGSKLAQAESLGVEIITGDELVKLLEELS